MITGYCKEGDVESARRLFDGIRVKDVISWNAMIAGSRFLSHHATWLILTTVLLPLKI
jgi:pentatricopeptide repeat protein